MLAATLTTALALAPVYMHRRLFRRRKKDVVVQYGHRLLSCALVGLAVVMTGTVLLIFDVVLGLDGGITAAAFVLLAIVLLAALPGRHVRGR